MKSHPALFLAAAAVWGCGVWAAQARLASDGPIVELGYATYRGYYNDTYDLNIWKSIRYAEPPTGDLRWQAPQKPRATNRSVTPAVDQPPMCPQSGAYGTPEAYGFNSGPGDEDCLYLNVYAAPGASDLPVLVWIHGGGYGLGGATNDPGELMNTNDNGFVFVEIQYRLGAFGFLSSEEVAKNGQLNAGLLDQHLALQWVQEHIAEFGGDAGRVTVAGESAGAGSVMYLAMAYGGQESHLFQNIIAASVYAPSLYDYSDSVPAGNYDSFAKSAGCSEKSTVPSRYASVFDGLIAADTEALQNASAKVTETRGYSLDAGNVSGKRLLVGNNANEGVPLTNPQVERRSQYDDFIENMYPRLNQDDVDELNSLYEIDDAEPGDDGVRFDTLGDKGPNALTQSGMATGIQQTAFNIAAESVFVCPGHWLAGAFSTGRRTAWKYQFSLTGAYHGADLGAYFPSGSGVPNADFRHAFQKVWGGFIIHDSPVISATEATAGRSNATVPAWGDDLHWPQYSPAHPRQMVFNTTGGYTALVNTTKELKYHVRKGAGIVNNFRLADASAWEGGRGERCEFWREVGTRIPV